MLNASMGRPKTDASGPSTPDRILSAAELEFAAVGYGAAKLADIAARAGIRRPSLLYHFSTKEELYAATVQRVFGRLGAALMGSMAAEGAFEDRLLETTTRYVAFLEKEPGVARIILREFLDQDGPGSALLVGQVAPLLDAVEQFIVSAGSDQIQPGLPIRAAIMQTATDVLLRSAAGALREPLWGPQDFAAELTRRLFLGR
jgi:AcrR family transcriptional regulator